MHFKCQSWNIPQWVSYDKKWLWSKLPKLTERPPGPDSVKLYPTPRPQLVLLVWQRILVIGYKPVCDFSGPTICNYKALPDRPHRGKVPFAHQTWWCPARASQSLREVVVKDSGSSGQSCSLHGWVPSTSAFILCLRWGLKQRSSGASAMASLWGWGRGYTLKTLLPTLTQYWVLFHI